MCSNSSWEQASLNSDSQAQPRRCSYNRQCSSQSKDWPCLSLVRVRGVFHHLRTCNAKSKPANLRSWGPRQGEASGTHVVPREHVALDPGSLGQSISGRGPGLEVEGTNEAQSEVDVPELRSVSLTGWNALLGTFNPSHTWCQAPFHLLQQAPQDFLVATRGHKNLSDKGSRQVQLCRHRGSRSRRFHLRSPICP